MTRSYTNWTVTSYSRPEYDHTGDGEPFATGGREEVVRVSDPRGWVWEVVMDGETIAALTITGRIDQNALRIIPLGYLAEVAASHLREVAHQMGHGAGAGEGVVNVTPEWVARDAAANNSGTLTRRGDPPTPEQFAQAWRETAAVAFREGNRERVTRRQALAERFAVSVYRVDQWTRAARDQGLIPARDPKTGGAPRQHQATSGKTARANRGRNMK